MIKLVPHCISNLPPEDPDVTLLFDYKLYCDLDKSSFQRAVFIRFLLDQDSKIHVCLLSICLDISCALVQANAVIYLVFLPC